ncbi:MAG: FAD-dependent protein [Bacteroidales bacterium]
MITEIDLTLAPCESSDMQAIHRKVCNELNIGIGEITYLKIIKRSIDARHRNIRVNIRVKVVYGQEQYRSQAPDYNFKNVHNQREVVIIGAGPAGLFAALRLIELGLKPIIYERGKDVSARKQDIAKLNREGLLNTESNYCYGEGGAGTFSDGKLYTRSTKRGNVQRILELLYLHKATEDILIDAHPHIGTDKLPEVIKNIRETILQSGGEIHFNTKLTDILLNTDNSIRGITVNNQYHDCTTLILATGHSARDIYFLLHEKGITLEAKSFAMGVRAEHTQAFVNKIQYHGNTDKCLPAASYTLKAQVNGRGVYSFCMCPGGIIVPSATNTNEIVVNGMSNSKRNSPFANSGIAVEIHPTDLQEYQQYGVLAGLYFQQHLEQLAFRNGTSKQVAPAQTIADFISGKLSSSLPDCSYIPGVVSSPLHFWLPQPIQETLKQGFIAFDRKMKGYASHESIIVGVESRTSSPVRIPRNPETYQHISTNGLYPCGEGAGYAGGIVSSAIDGYNTAEKIAENLRHNK